MTLLCRLVIAFVIGVGTANSALAQSSFGSFAGVVTNQKINKDQLVKLELIHMSEESGSIQLRALLTLQLGGFESGEYVTYHFENVIFNVLTGVIAFNQTDQEVYLSEVALKNGVLSGDLNSSNGHIGPVKLSSRTTIQPANDLVQPLGGEYTGMCGAKPSSLQLFTFRSTLDTTRLGNPFGAYEAKGQLGQFNPGYCSAKKTDHCTYAKIESASYNFFNGDLVLKGFPFTYACRVTGSNIDCGECQFTRTSNEMKSPKLQTRRYAVDPIDDIEKKLTKTTSRSLRGSYTGYIFHENLDLFQKVRLDITTFDKTTDTGIELTISSVATVQFGELENEEITYKFDPVALPNPVLPPRVILSRPQDDVDPEVKINSVMGGVIRGTWNSNIFGRVGSFVVTRNGDLPELPETRLMKSLSSGYEEVGGKRFIANLVIAKGNAPIGSDNPYYPLTMNGYVWRRVQTSLKDPITGGSYDFYTGKIAVLFGAQKTLTGFIKTGSDAKLRRLGGGFGTLMQEFTPMEYRKINKLPR